MGASQALSPYWAGLVQHLLLKTGPKDLKRARPAGNNIPTDLLNGEDLPAQGMEGVVSLQGPHKAQPSLTLMQAHLEISGLPSPQKFGGQQGGRSGICIYGVGLPRRGLLWFW